mmetsp:Transcript_15008/g.41515  ORF Transcript_15008/g.41515 Transcript_15008/m.41515 type:complete len:147 (+) Transcript_15008:55-495(+)
MEEKKTEEEVPETHSGKGKHVEEKPDLKDDSVGDDQTDLYEDLTDAQPAPAAVRPPKRQKTSISSHLQAESSYADNNSSTSNNNNSNPPVRSLVEEVEYLQQRVESLQDENTILKRNMGTLYRTAQAEIRRKDEELERLSLLQMPK